MTNCGRNGQRAKLRIREMFISWKVFGNVEQVYEDLLRHRMKSKKLSILHNENMAECQQLLLVICSDKTD